MNRGMIIKIIRSATMVSLHRRLNHTHTVAEAVSHLPQLPPTKKTALPQSTRASPHYLQVLHCGRCLSRKVEKSPCATTHFIRAISYNFRIFSCLEKNPENIFSGLFLVSFSFEKRPCATRQKIRFFTK